MGADGSHNSSVPPPFLTKTYEMVDDPVTDNIVSWSENSSSFVVWNVADFTKDLLPQYFKHNNFSSFVRQLNTYGFHKIDPDRQEFANEGFAKGNKDGLKHIHRRKPSASPSQKDALNSCNDPAHAELEGEIQKLKEDKGMLINELVKVKQLQETTEIELETLGQRLQALEERQHRIMTFLGRAMHNPAFTQFIQHGESLALSKKRRLPEQGSLIGIGESWDEEGGQLVRYSSGDTGELMSEGQIAQRSEGVSGSESSLDFVLRRFAVSTLNQSDETSPLSHSSGVTLWEMQSTMAEHAANVEVAGNCAVRSPSEAVECSDFICQGGDLKEDVIKADLISLHISCEVEVDHDKPTPSDARNKDRSEGSKACGSNDVFWESMLTENPRLLTDRDSQDSRCEGHSNERWFL